MSLAGPRWVPFGDAAIDLHTREQVTPSPEQLRPHIKCYGRCISGSYPTSWALEPAVRDLCHELNMRDDPLYARQFTIPLLKRR